MQDYIMKSPIEDIDDLIDELEEAFDCMSDIIKNDNTKFTEKDLRSEYVGDDVDGYIQWMRRIGKVIEQH